MVTIVNGISISQTMEDGMTKTYVWSLFTRLFHLISALLIIFLFISGEEDDLLDFHVIAGVSVGVLYIFRVIWGFMDVKYSKFSDFDFSIKNLFEYLINIKNHKKYLGHNPASSFAIIAMIGLVFLSTLSGVLLYGVQEARGVLGFLNSEFYSYMHDIEEFHEAVTTLLMFVIGAHVAGVLLDRVFHGKDTVTSIVNGYKEVEGESLKTTLLQKLFGLVAIIIVLTTLIYGFRGGAITKDYNVQIDYEVAHPAFAKECKECHTLYPPFLLPRASWERMMGELENHFGDDASLDESTMVSIRDYLVANSAESSSKEAAFYMMRSLKTKDELAITKSPYWIKKHKEISKETFSSKKIGSSSNCKACHNKIEKGLINDSEIFINN